MYDSFEVHTPFERNDCSRVPFATATRTTPGVLAEERAEKRARSLQLPPREPKSMRFEAEDGDHGGVELHDTPQVQAWPVDASHSGKSSSLCRYQFEKIPV